MDDREQQTLHHSRVNAGPEIQVFGVFRGNVHDSLRPLELAARSTYRYACASKTSRVYIAELKRENADVRNASYDDDPEINV